MSTPPSPRRSFRRRRSALAGVAAIALLGALAGCGSDETTSAEGDGAVYRVGLAGVLSGPAASGGTAIANGAELAAEEINDSGHLGAGKSIELSVKDAKADPAQAIAIYRQFVADDYSAVLCCALSAEAGALAPQITEAEVPAVTTSTVLEDFASAPYVYRPYVLPDQDDGLYDKFLDMVVPAEDIESAVVVVTSDNDGMVALADQITAGLERHGVKVLKRIDTATADTSFVSQATQIASLAPDAVIASTTFMPTALLSKALQERDVDSTILTYGIDSKAVFEASGGGLAGALFPSAFSARFSSNELAPGFAKAYEERFDAEPDMYAAQGYTAMWLVAEGLKAAGTGDPQELAKAMASISSQDTVFGTVDYENGQAIMREPGVVLTWSEQGEMEEWTP